MTSFKLFRLTFTLFLALGISVTSLYSQPGGGGGGGGAGGGQGQRGGGQRGGQQNMKNLSPEEQRKRINEMIQKGVVEMAEAVEVREDQQEAFVKAQARYEIESFKIRAKMQQSGRDRNKRQAAMQSMQKLGKDTTKIMKDILDKDQIKLYNAALKKRMPQGRGGRGGGRQR